LEDSARLVKALMALARAQRVLASAAVWAALDLVASMVLTARMVLTAATVETVAVAVAMANDAWLLDL
jgi:hypothetical protein